MFKVIAIAIGCIALTGCYETTVKKNVECKSHAEQLTCEADARCMWHDKEDGTFRCKSKQ